MPSLHGRLTLDEAIAELGGEPSYYCDRQFVVLKTAVLCAFSMDAAELLSPSRLRWRARRLDYEPNDEPPWLPARVREVWGSDRRKIKQHHLLIRQRAEEHFLYAGTAHLGNYSLSPKEPIAEFELDGKLSKSAWLAFGGYTGCEVDLDHSTTHIAVGDTRKFEAVLNKITTKERSHISITRHEEDALTVFFNARRAWLMYKHNPQDSGLCVEGDASAPGETALFQCDCGIALTFPSHNTVSKAVAIKLLLRFFSTGSLPTDVLWTEA